MTRLPTKQSSGPRPARYRSCLNAELACWRAQPHAGAATRLPRPAASSANASPMTRLVVDCGPGLKHPRRASMETAHDFPWLRSALSPLPPECRHPGSASEQWNGPDPPDRRTTRRTHVPSSRPAAAVPLARLAAAAPAAGAPASSLPQTAVPAPSTAQGSFLDYGISRASHPLRSSCLSEPTTTGSSHGPPEDPSRSPQQEPTFRAARGTGAAAAPERPMTVAGRADCPASERLNGRR